MNILENLKLDKWYGIVLYLGILMILASLLFDVKYLEEKHTFGFGLGLVMIGLSNFMAEKTESAFKPNNFSTGPAGILSWRVIKHNPVTFIIPIIGIGLTLLFGFLIVKSLI
jgi:hypothetical protein